jgi:Na+/melibiose symporter-like transporter
LSEILIEEALFYNWVLADPLLPFIDIILILMNIIPVIAIIAFLLFWRKLSLTIGIKKLLKYLMLALFVLTIALIFLADLVSGFILMFLINAGLSGLVFVKYLFLAIIIDNYYLNTSKRREATYYGISSIFAIIPAFLGTFLAQFNTIFTLLFVSPFSGIRDYFLFSKIGICLVALIFIGISIILIRKFPLDKERYNSIENEIAAINTRK